MWLVLVDNKLADEIPAKKEKRKPSNTAKKTRIFRSQKYKRRSHKSFPKNAEEKTGPRCHSNKEQRARILSIVNNINNRICFLIDKKSLFYSNRTILWLETIAHALVRKTSYLIDLSSFLPLYRNLLNTENDHFQYSSISWLNTLLGLIAISALTGSSL